MKTKEIIPTLHPNLGDNERLVSVLSGSVLLIQAIMGKKKVLPAIAGAYLLFRGSSGYCMVSDAIKSGMDMKSNDIEIATSITVDKPVNEVYSFWRRLENLPLFMRHLKNVEQLDDKLSEWEAKIPGVPGSISWKAEITDDVENKFIEWRSLPESDVENEGRVLFTELGKNSTVIHVLISYKAPAGKLGEKVAGWLNPLFDKMVRNDVKNFSTYLESTNWKLAKAHV